MDGCGRAIAVQEEDEEISIFLNLSPHHLGLSGERNLLADVKWRRHLGKR